MLSVLTSQEHGLLVHYGPTLNSPMSREGNQVTLDNVTFDTFVDWNYPHVSVLYRVQFPLDTNTSAQVWYYVEDNAVGGEKNLRGWIAVQMEDKFYIEGAGIDGFNVELPDDVNSDPCKGYSPTVNDPTYVHNPNDPDDKLTITFPYDRKTAIEYGIIQAFENHSDPPPDDPDEREGYYEDNDFDRRVTRPVAGYSFPNFDYASLGTNGTNSALFTSEAIWMGGLPMTYIDQTCPTNEDQHGTWCLDFSGNNGYVASKAWRLHPALVAYYTGTDHPLIYDPQQSIRYQNSFLINTTPQIGDFVVRASIESIPPLSESNPISNREDRYAADGVENFFRFADDAFAYQDAAVDLADWAQYYLNYNPTTYNVNPIEKGDYIIISSSADRHGFIVVGWGDIATCTQAEQISSANPTPVFYDTWQSNTVPYVVDYSYAVDATTSNDRTQTPIARPFYCSAVALDPGSFGDHDWYFYHLPHSITISVDNLHIPVR